MFTSCAPKRTATWYSQNPCNLHKRIYVHLWLDNLSVTFGDSSLYTREPSGDGYLHCKSHNFP